MSNFQGSEQCDMCRAEHAVQTTPARLHINGNPGYRRWAGDLCDYHSCRSDVVEAGIRPAPRTLKRGMRLIIEVDEYSYKFVAGLYEVCQDFCLDGDWSERKMTTDELLKGLVDEGIIRHVPTAELWINNHHTPTPVSEFRWDLDLKNSDRLIKESDRLIGGR